MVSRKLSLGIPPLHGEPGVAYYADVCAKLLPAAWLDWRYGQVGTAGYVPMLWDGNVERMAQAAERVHAAALPEMMMLFNEPEREGQADMTPVQAAHALRQWGKLVNSWVVPCAVGGVNVSVHYGQAPYAWLDAFVGLLSDADRRQVAYWHIHAYGPVVAFAEALSRFRAWMRQVGMVRPVIVSECGTDDRPAALMRYLEALIEDGILHSAYWFSAYYAPWNETGLLDADGELTEIGEAWMRQAHEVSLPLVMRAA